MPRILPIRGVILLDKTQFHVRHLYVYPGTKWRPEFAQGPASFSSPFWSYHTVYVARGNSLHRWNNNHNQPSQFYNVKKLWWIILWRTLFSFDYIESLYYNMLCSYGKSNWNWWTNTRQWSKAKMRNVNNCTCEVYSVFYLLCADILDIFTSTYTSLPLNHIRVVSYFRSLWLSYLYLVATYQSKATLKMGNLPNSFQLWQPKCKIYVHCANWYLKKEKKT